MAPPPLPPRERRPIEPGEEEEGSRSRFQRDRDAIIYTTAFRRLAGVTQVVSPSEGLVVHNRLTHTLEVAQIALRLAERLNSLSPILVQTYGGLDPSVVEAAAFAHDLGHPPFGHIAEKTLNRLIVGEGFVDGYEGNAQAFRLVTQLCVRLLPIPGLNLTRAVLNAILKYPWTQQARAGDENEFEQAERKWGAYTTERSYLQFARETQPAGQETWQSLEAQVMDWADDIAYSVSDTEDFYRAGLIPLDRILSGERGAREFIQAVFSRWEDNNLTDTLRGPFSLLDLETTFVNLCQELPPITRPFDDRRDIRAALRTLTSVLIGRYVQNTTLRQQPNVGMRSFLDIQPVHRMEIKMLKELTWQYVIKNSALAGQQRGQQHIITGLFEIFQEAISSDDRDDWDVLPARDRDALNALVANGTDLTPVMIARLTADAISGMTDQQAILMYHRLNGIDSTGAFDNRAR